MASELKKSFVSGMAWSTLEKIGSMVLQLSVSIFLGWYLVPADRAAEGLLIVFIAVSAVFVDSGFSATLIRRKEVSGEDYNSVFFFNVAASLVLYGIVVAITPFMADFFNMPILRKAAPIMCLIIPINSFGIIQSTMLSRRMDFKSYTKYTLWGNLIAGIVAVVMILLGAGFWAIVGQRLAFPLVRVSLLWINSDWRPSLKFRAAPLKSMFGYSSRLFVSDLANSVYSNISQLIIGRMSTPDLGYYEQARKLKDMPVASIVGAIQGVTFPAMSKMQDNTSKLSHTSHQVIEVMNFLIFPVMIGLIAVAQDMFSVILPERWMPSVPYFRILCISGFFAPVSVISYNILKTKSDGRLILRLEIIKKAVATVILAITIPIGIKAIVVGQTAIFLSDAIFNSVGASRYVPWRLKDRVREIIPYLIMSLVMLAGVHFTGVLLAGKVAVWVMLLIKIFVGVAIYAGLAYILRPEGMREVKIILRGEK